MQHMQVVAQPVRRQRSDSDADSEREPQRPRRAAAGAGQGGTRRRDSSDADSEREVQRPRRPAPGAGQGALRQRSGSDEDGRQPRRRPPARPQARQRPASDAESENDAQEPRRARRPRAKSEARSRSATPGLEFEELRRMGLIDTGSPPPRSRSRGRAQNPAIEEGRASRARTGRLVAAAREGPQALEDAPAPQPAPGARAPGLERMRRSHSVPIEVPREVMDALIEGMRPKRRQRSPQQLALPPIPEDTSGGGALVPVAKAPARRRLVGKQPAPPLALEDAPRAAAPARRRLRGKQPAPRAQPEQRPARGRYGPYTAG
jgi:hypothetical protein